MEISDDFKNTTLLQPLAALGPVVELNGQINEAQFNDEVQQLESFWRPYNPRKAISRYGISLTSRNGEMDGVDLDSLAELNRTHGTQLKEKDFTKVTDAYKRLNSINSFLNQFEGQLGRTHLIRLDRGGHFPPHRDAFGPNLSAFRIIVLCSNSMSNDFYFIQDRERLNIKPWVPYFIDTRREHAAFSFVDNSIQLVVNVIISEESIKKTLNMALIK